MTYKNYLENIKGYSTSTVKMYCKYAKELEESEMKYEVLAEKYSSYSNNSKRLLFSAIKKYYQFKKDRRFEELELPKKEVKDQDFVSFEQYKEITQKINKRTKTGFSKYVMIRILFETGIRSSELLQLTKNSIVDNRIMINGKGNRRRFVWISEWLKTDIMELINSQETERLFPFSYKNLYQKIRNISTEKITPHMFRRGYAKYCFEKDISIYDISLSMGHSSIETTTQYIKRSTLDTKIHQIF